MEKNCPITGFKFKQRTGDNELFVDERGRASHKISDNALRTLASEPEHILRWLEARLYDAKEEMSGNEIPMITRDDHYGYEIVPQPWNR